MHTTLVRKSVAGLAMVGGLIAGSAGLAAAATTGPTTGATGTTGARPNAELVCERAQIAWDHLVAVDAELHRHYHALVALRDEAAAAGRTDLADQLTRRLDRVKDRHVKVEARVVEIHDKVAATCASIPDVPPTTELG